MALFMDAVTAGYLIIWFVAIVGLYVYLNYNCADDECADSTNILIIYFTMLLFFFWTAEVLKNIVVVTTVGVVALWWTSQVCWSTPSRLLSEHSQSVATT